MKFNRIIWMWLVLVGMGAALLSANPACAQQDMDPTYFEVTPGVPQTPATQQMDTARNLQAEDARTAMTGGSVIRQEKDDTLDGGLARMIVIYTMIMATLIGGSGLIAWFGIAQTRRYGRPQPSRQSVPYAEPAGATAQ